MNVVWAAFEAVYYVNGFPLLETSRGKCFRLKVKCEQLITSFRSTASAFNIQQLFLHKCKYGKICSVCKAPIWCLKLSTWRGNKLCVEKRNSSKQDFFGKVILLSCRYIPLLLKLNICVHCCGLSRFHQGKGL